MTTYEIVKFIYEFISEVEGKQITHYFAGLESQEDANWHAKNFCDCYKHKLVSVKPITQQEYDKRFQL